MTGWSISPDPYTPKQRASAVPDDGQHPVVLKPLAYRGDDNRCGVLVLAPKSSAYGIRPCLRPVRVEGRGKDAKWVHIHVGEY